MALLTECMWFLEEYGVLFKGYWVFNLAECKVVLTESSALLTEFRALLREYGTESTEYRATLTERT